MTALRCLAPLAALAVIIFAMWINYKWCMKDEGNDILPPSAYVRLPTNRK